MGVRLSLTKFINLGEKMYAMRPIVRSMDWKVKPLLAFHWADLIESLQETVVQPDSMREKGLMRVDVIEQVGSEGPHLYGGLGGGMMLAGTLAIAGDVRSGGLDLHANRGCRQGDRREQRR